MARLSFLAALLCCGPMLSLHAQQSPQQSQPRPSVPTRDAAPARPQMRAGSISGQITAAANDAPLNRVKLTLTGSTPNPLTAITDDRGEYEFTDVPAGTYSLSATRAGYLTVLYGQRRPREAGRPVEVKAGIDLKHVDIALVRGAVLAGRILDELGDPYPGVRVEALEPRFINGRRIAVPAGIDTTDDIGEFRISGLNPGTYTIRASSVETWESESGNDTFVYTPTYYPGSLLSDRAEPIAVAVGREVSNLSFALGVGRAMKVSGRVENAAGDPLPNMPVFLERISRTIGGALLSSGAAGNGRSGADGTFSIAKMPPGEYVLAARFSANESASRTVFLTDADLSGFTLAPYVETTLAGTIVTDDGAPLPVPAARLQVAPIATNDGAGLQLWGGESPQTVRADASFAFNGITGQYLFRVNGLPADWLLQSVTINGTNVTDTPMDIAQGAPPISGARLVVSHQGASVSGVVLDAHGSPLVDSSVVVFADDASKWGPGSRFVKSVRPDQDGKFIVAGLPASSYLVAATDFMAEGDWEDPARLRALQPDAMRVTLPAGTTESLTLKVEMR